MSNELCGVLRPEEEKAVRQAIPKTARRALLEAVRLVEQGNSGLAWHRPVNGGYILAQGPAKAGNQPAKNGVQATQIQGIA